MSLSDWAIDHLTAEQRQELRRLYFVGHVLELRDFHDRHQLSGTVYLGCHCDWETHVRSQIKKLLEDDQL